LQNLLEIFKKKTKENSKGMQKKAQWILHLDEYAFKNFKKWWKSVFYEIGSAYI